MFVSRYHYAKLIVIRAILVNVMAIAKWALILDMLFG